MELMLKSWCNLHGLKLNHGLIQNDVAISLSTAKQVQPVCYALKGGHRECRDCKEEFDIQNGGYLYTCHGCAPVVSEQA